MKKVISRVPALALAAALAVAAVMPLASRAGNEGRSGDTEPGRGNSIMSSWVRAVDGSGDANAIGKFNRNEANKSLVRANGTVKVVSASSITVTTFSKNGEGVVTAKDYTFTVDSSTTVIRKFKGTASIAEVGVGDKVKVWATSLTDGTAKLIWDKSIWWIALNGTINALNSTDMTFNLLVSRKEPQTGLMMTMTVPVKTSSATTYFKADGTAGLFTDLADDQKVAVRGSFNTVGKYVWAKKVTIKP